MKCDAASAAKKPYGATQRAVTEGLVDGERLGIYLKHPEWVASEQRALAACLKSSPRPAIEA